ncbi:MAG: nuclease-related domain-containing protein [Verrucomicrobiota bacterium]
MRALIAKRNEKQFWVVFLALLTPVSCFLITCSLIIFLYPQASLPFAYSICVSAALAGLVLASLAVLNDIQSIANMELGMEGEKVIADRLRPLERETWRVFHDIPASENGKEFNLDHVVVGSRGIAIVETKTRRKGKARKGRKDREVTFDGHKLDWPWGESTSELVQLKRQREWLEKWIKKQTGKDVSALPILAIPGWWITPNNPRARTRVVNEKQICSAFEETAKGLQELGDETADLIARQIESLCRITG